MYEYQISPLKYASLVIKNLFILLYEFHAVILIIENILNMIPQASHHLLIPLATSQIHSSNSKQY